MPGNDGAIPVEPANRLENISKGCPAILFYFKDIICVRQGLYTRWKIFI